MLYVKVDAAGNPVEVAKNEMTIRTELAAANVILPAILNREKWIELGYAEIPTTADPVPPQPGKMAVPDVPTKNADGTFTRKWKYIDAENEASMVKAKKIERARLLAKYADNISPMRWEEMTEVEKTEVKEWRLSLLNATADEAWPYITYNPVPAVLRNKF